MEKDIFKKENVKTPLNYDFIFVEEENKLIEQKVAEIINNLIKEGISYKLVEAILTITKENYLMLIPSK